MKKITVPALAEFHTTIKPGSTPVASRVDVARQSGGGQRRPPRREGRLEKGRGQARLTQCGMINPLPRVTCAGSPRPRMPPALLDPEEGSSWFVRDHTPRLIHGSGQTRFCARLPVRPCRPDRCRTAHPQVFRSEPPPIPGLRRDGVEGMIKGFIPSSSWESTETQGVICGCRKRIFQRFLIIT